MINKVKLTVNGERIAEGSNIDECFNNYNQAYSQDSLNKRIHELEAKLKRVGELIHYPDCWDTVAYPTVFDALNEIGCNVEDCTKKVLNDERS